MTVKGILPESSRFGLVAGSETGPTGQGEEAQIVTWSREMVKLGDIIKWKVKLGEIGWRWGTQYRCCFVGRFGGGKPCLEDNVRGVTLLQQVRWICILTATTFCSSKRFPLSCQFILGRPLVRKKCHDYGCRKDISCRPLHWSFP